ncbi:MAG: HAD family hydrolase [Actinomycetota bacterium]
MTVTLAMWSGPRNLSTALMRAWENRPDTEVLDEPLYAHYLARTGLDHPGRDDILAAGPVDLDAAVDRCRNPPGAPTLSYQKHMSHHLLPGMDTSWLDDVHNVLLIRHPVEVLASYTQVRAEVTLADIGLPQQVDLVDRCALVIDAADFLTDPEAHLRTLCALLEVDFTETMLTWPAGRRHSDGVWAPHWYASVEASTGFAPPRSAEERAAGRARLHPDLAPLAAEAVSLYDDLAARRLRL